MTTILLILILIGATLALITGIRAVRAGLRVRRARAELHDRLSGEVDDLVLRTGELEKNLAALDARAQTLPIRVSDLQRNLARLRILTGALATSLRQLQRALSYAEIKTFSATRLSKLLEHRPKP
jgi:hypothetical protein